MPYLDPPARRHLLVTLLALALLFAFDASPLDLLLARPLGTPSGFPWRDHWLLYDVLHEGGRRLSWLLALLLTLAVWWPVGVLNRLAQRERVQLAVVVLASVLLIGALKWLSLTSCPWELAEFGGVARYLSHWQPGPDGGSGHCFPAGHASAGFAFVGGYFVLRRHAERAAWAWLAIALGAGLVMGVAQQLRGAHFMSHTLWTAWFCWTLAGVVDALLHARWSRPARRAVGDRFPASAGGAEHPVRHRVRRFAALLLQPLHHTRAVAHRLVLAHLPLAHERTQRDLDAHDRP